MASVLARFLISTKYLRLSYVYCEESYSTQSSGRQEHNTRTRSCLVRMLATHAIACLMGGRGGGGDVGRQEARESGASFAHCSHLPSWGQSILQ